MRRKIRALFAVKLKCVTDNSPRVAAGGAAGRLRSHVDRCWAMRPAFFDYLADAIGRHDPGMTLFAAHALTGHPWTA